MISLTGTTVLLLCVVLAIGLPVLALGCWHRVRGSRAVRAIQRAGLLAGSQLAAVLLVAVALNDYGDFYGSWHSLLRGSPGSARIAAAPAANGHRTALPAGRVHQQADASFSTRDQWPTRGRLESIAITGANSELVAHAWVYLPPQYFQASYAHSPFPAIEVLSPSAAGDTLIPPGSYPQVMLSLIDARRAAPTALVLLQPSVGGPPATQCTDVPSGPQAQTFYAVDLPSQLARSYRLRATDWGAFGTGAGGYCAAKLAMVHPQTFTAAVTVDSSHFAAMRTPTSGDPWDGSRILRNENDLSWRLQHLPAPPISLLVVSGADRLAQAGTAAFSALSRPPMILAHVSDPYGKSPRAGLPDELAWLAARLPAPVPVR